jgi:hypothetical protein
MTPLPTPGARADMAQPALSHLVVSSLSHHPGRGHAGEEIVEQFARRQIASTESPSSGQQLCALRRLHGWTWGPWLSVERPVGHQAHPQEVSQTRPHLRRDRELPGLRVLLGKAGARRVTPKTHTVREGAMKDALPSRAADYRIRAAETRARAEATNDPDARAALLKDCDTWERMAEWEDETHRGDRDLKLTHLKD